jgi:hypothetical protein
VTELGIESVEILFLLNPAKYSTELGINTLVIPEFQKAHPVIDFTEGGMTREMLPPPKSKFPKEQLSILASEVGIDI